MRRKRASLQPDDDEDAPAHAYRKMQDAVDDALSVIKILQVTTKYGEETVEVATAEDME